MTRATGVDYDLVSVENPPPRLGGSAFHPLEFLQNPHSNCSPIVLFNKKKLRGVLYSTLSGELPRIFLVNGRVIDRSGPHLGQSHVLDTMFRIQNQKKWRTFDPRRVDGCLTFPEPRPYTEAHCWVDSLDKLVTCRTDSQTPASLQSSTVKTVDCRECLREHVLLG